MDSYSPLTNTYGTSRYAGNARNFYDIFIECIREESGGISRLVLEQAMHEIHSKYSIEGLEKMANTLDYNRTELRCAYVYLYCTCHVWMVIEAFEDLNFRKRNFMRNLVEDCVRLDGQINVCSIGGGPGSDIVATLVYLKQMEMFENYHVKVDLVDGYPEWGKTFECIMNVMNAKSLFPLNSPSVTFQDLLLGLSNLTRAILAKAHLVTMVKFVSAIYADKDRSEELLRKIFNLMRIGAVLLLIDNSGGHVFDFAQKVAEMCGFEVVIKPKKHILFQLDENLEPSIRLRNYEKPPQRSAKVSVVFMEKVMDMSVRRKRMGSSSFQRDMTNRGHEHSYKKLKRRKRYLDESCPLDPHKIGNLEFSNAMPFIYKTKKMPYNETIRVPTKSAACTSKAFSGTSSSTKEEILTMNDIGRKAFQNEASVTLGSTMSTPVQDEIPTYKIDSENFNTSARNSETILDTKDDFPLPPWGFFLKNDIAKKTIVNLDSDKSTPFQNEALTNDSSSDKIDSSIPRISEATLDTKDKLPQLGTFFKNDISNEPILNLDSDKATPIQNEAPTSYKSSDQKASTTLQNSGATLDTKEELPALAKEPIANLYSDKSNYVQNETPTSENSSAKTVSTIPQNELRPWGSSVKNDIAKELIINLDSDKSTLIQNKAPTNDSSSAKNVFLEEDLKLAQHSKLSVPVVNELPKSSIASCDNETLKAPPGDTTRSKDISESNAESREQQGTQPDVCDPSLVMVNQNLTDNTFCPNPGASFSQTSSTSGDTEGHSYSQTASY